MPKKLLDTEARRKITNARDRATKRLVDHGWKFDGLWWHSPYGNLLRYSRREAVCVEELREWAEGDSAFLGDKDHSMWVKAEEDSNRLLTWEELEEQSKRRNELKKLALQFP